MAATKGAAPAVPAKPRIKGNGKTGREIGRVKPQYEAALPRRSDRVDPIFAGDKQYAEGAAKDRANG